MQEKNSAQSNPVGTKKTTEVSAKTSGPCDKIILRPAMNDFEEQITKDSASHSWYDDTSLKLNK